LPGRDEVVAWLGLGGNLGDPEASMASALAALDADPATHVAAVSPLYRTPPWGRTDQPDFLNAVARVETRRSARELLALCLEVERGLKRIRRERWGPRTLDIDILLYGDLQLREPGLEVPHPRLAERAFVLVPLGEIAPDLAVGERRVRDLLACVDTSGIVRASPDGSWWQGRPGGN
jgi:2-amino-4-hydroxy-6-hydroxymethyldihydropteridine diphosphokinase